MSRSTTYNIRLSDAPAGCNIWYEHRTPEPDERERASDEATLFRIHVTLPMVSAGRVLAAPVGARLDLGHRHGRWYISVVIFDNRKALTIPEHSALDRLHLKVASQQSNVETDDKRALAIARAALDLRQKLFKLLVKAALQTETDLEARWRAKSTSLWGRPPRAAAWPGHPDKLIVEIGNSLKHDETLYEGVGFVKVPAVYGFGRGDCSTWELSQRAASLLLAAAV